MIALEKASEDTSFPSDAETARKHLTRLHDLKRSMLEAFMVALQEGRALLEKLQELENLGTLDSRPGHTRAEAQLGEFNACKCKQTGVLLFYYYLC